MGKRLVYPVPCKGKEKQCRDDIVTVLSASHRDLSTYDEQHLSELLFKMELVQPGFRSGNSWRSLNKYSFFAMVPTNTCFWLVDKLNALSTQHLLGLVKCETEELLSYIYEIYKQAIDATHDGYNCKQSNSFFKRLIMNGAPEYFLKDLQRRLNKQTRPEVVLSAITSMSEMRQWWYDYVNTYALQWVLAPPKEVESIHAALILHYSKLQKVRIIPSEGTKVDKQ